MNLDTVSLMKENIRIVVGKDGILSFTWASSSAEPVVKESQTALISFETQPMLTLNAIDGSVVSRQLGY